MCIVHFMNVPWLKRTVNSAPRRKEFADRLSQNALNTHRAGKQTRGPSQYLGRTSCATVRRPRPWCRPRVSVSRPASKSDGPRAACSTRTAWRTGRARPRRRTWTPRWLPTTCTPPIPRTTRTADRTPRSCRRPVRRAAGEKKWSRRRPRPWS